MRVAIVHARWNSSVISVLVDGAKKALLAAGVAEENIELQDVPGSYELPYAVQKIYAASTIQSSTSGAVSATDLLASISTTDLTSTPSQGKKGSASSSPFDAIIAIGVLIKGETMHFEYIADAVSHGLMKVQLESGVPVIFGLLTVLNEDQAKARAGIGSGHNHGEDWGAAAVELGAKRKFWAQGKMF